MISPNQVPLLISSYDKAMEAFVRLVHFDRASDIDFKCEVKNFSIPLAHDDLMMLSLMLRKIIEICGLVETSKTSTLHYGGETYSIFKIISRIIHSTELEAHTDTFTLELNGAELHNSDDVVNFYVQNQPTNKRINPVVTLKSHTDGETSFKLRDFLEKVDAIIYEATEIGAAQRVFLERNIREF